MVKPRSVVKFTASSTEISGARPVAGRKPASASLTEQRKRRTNREGLLVTSCGSPGGCFILSYT